MLNISGLKHNISLAPYTTYKIGGPAKYFIIAKNKDELAKYVIEARNKDVPYFILGLGANILIGDKGFDGLVIKNEAKSFEAAKNFFTAESGSTVSDIIEHTKALGLSGFEHYVGIPSTVGGALWQNLHFLPPDRKSTVFIDSILKSAKILTAENNIVVVDKDYFRFGYDFSILHEKEIVILEATFQLEEKEQTLIQNQIDENLKWRNSKQPQLVEFPSCGSVFKKIDGVGAGRLIEKVGLKGFTVGGVKVSEKHANYLVNTGDATAQDVVKLIKLIQEKVLKETSFSLETEIKFVGNF